MAHEREKNSENKLLHRDSLMDKHRVLFLGEAGGCTAASQAREQRVHACPSAQLLVQCPQALQVELAAATVSFKEKEMPLRSSLPKPQFFVGGKDTLLWHKNSRALGKPFKPVPCRNSYQCVTNSSLPMKAARRVRCVLARCPSSRQTDLISTLR